MEHTGPQLISTSELAPVHSSGTTPFSQQTVVLTKQAYIELKWEANYWRAQHARLVEREAALKADVEALQATIRDLTQRLYGATSEKSACPDRAGESKLASPRKRGQQPGSTGHGRSDRTALPVVTEVHDVREAEKHCPVCGEAFRPFPGMEESSMIEVQVQAYIRRIQRQRYSKACQCPQVAGIVMAPPASRLIPKSPLGVSVWVLIMLDKYLYSRPTYRFCEELRHHGLPLAQGTITDGLHRLAVLFEPMMQALHERQMGEKLFHGDETRWEVFEEVEGKTGHRWYLWVTRSVSVVFYRMAPGRGADIPTTHFAKLKRDLVEAVLVCDRYSAYKCFAKGSEAIILAYCWAHVRRDFLNAARSWPELDSWMWAWVEDIRTLYRLNAARIKVWDDTLPVHQQSPAFIEHHRDLKTQLSQMQARYEVYLQEKDLHRAKTKVLTSLHNHWDGLTVFVERPEVTMDNNSAERALRNPVVGRKNYYGSGSVWSAHLAAMMFSVLQTVLLWDLNPHHWLTAFLHACADHGGKSPTDLSAFLPWKMTPERRAELARPVSATLPSFASASQAMGEPEAANTS
jgi:transposase